MSVYFETRYWIELGDEPGAPRVERLNNSWRPGQEGPRPPAHSWQAAGHEATQDLLRAVCQASGQPVPDDRPADPPYWKPGDQDGDLADVDLVLWHQCRKVARVSDCGFWEAYCLKSRHEDELLGEFDSLAEAIVAAEAAVGAGAAVREIMPQLPPEVGAALMALLEGDAED